MPCRARHEQLHSQERVPTGSRSQQLCSQVVHSQAEPCDPGLLEVPEAEGRVPTLPTPALPRGNVPAGTEVPCLRTMPTRKVPSGCGEV